MDKLLKAGFRRYTHSSFFWACFISSFVFGSSLAYTARTVDFDFSFCMLLLIVNAALITVFIGNEFNEGIFRCKVAVGHTRKQIFISEAVLAFAATLLMYIMHFLLIALFNYEVFGFVDIKIIAFIFIGILLITFSFTSLFVFISCAISKRTVSTIISILLTVIFFLTSIKISDSLKYPEYRDMTHKVPDENGEYTLVTDKAPHPNYVGGMLRTVFEVSQDISPSGQLLKYSKLFSPMFNLRFISEDNKPWGTDIYEEFISTGVYAPWQELLDLSFLPFYQMGFIALMLCGGYLIFRRKDLK